MALKIFFIRLTDLPFDDMDGKSVKFSLIGKREGRIAGVGKFDLIPSINGLARLLIRCDLSNGDLVMIPMRKVFLKHITRNPNDSEFDFTLDFRR
jgi:hypothetical protein